MIIRISAEDETDSTVLARQLRQSLLAGGYPSKALNVGRKSQENMDLGSILSIDWLAVVDFFKEVAGDAILAKEVYNLLGRQKSKIRVSIGKNDYILSKGMSEEEIEVVLKKILKSDDGIKK